MVRIFPRGALKFGIIIQLMCRLAWWISASNINVFSMSSIIFSYFYLYIHLNLGMNLGTSILLPEGLQDWGSLFG
jgi:hypothetical protein